MSSHPHVLAVECPNVERLGLLARMGGRHPRVDLQVAHQPTLLGPAREHALDGLEQTTLWERALEDLPWGFFLQAARISPVPLIELVFALLAGEDDLVGVDHDDVIAA